MSGKKKLSAGIALFLSTVLILNNMSFTVFAADNEVFNIPTVQNGDVLDLADTSLMGVNLPKDIGKNKSFDLVLDGAEWNLPSDSGTLQDLFGSDAVYKEKIGHDTKAVPFAKPYTGTVTFSGADKSGVEYPEVMYLDDLGNIVSSNGEIASGGNYYDTPYGTVFSPMVAQGTALSIVNLHGLVGNFETGFDLVATSAGGIEYNTDFSAITSGITWTSNSPSVVAVSSDSSVRHRVTLTKVSNGTAKITAKAKNASGDTITLADFNVRVGDLSGSPTINLTSVTSGATFSPANFTLTMDSDTVEAKFTLTANNVSEAVLLETDSPYLEITKANDLVTLKKPLDLANHEYATIRATTGGVEFATIMVTMRANRLLEVTEVLVSGTDLGRYGSQNILATYTGSNTPSGSIIVKTASGLTSGETVNWSLTKIGSTGDTSNVVMPASSLVTADNQVTLNISSIGGIAAVQIFEIKGTNESGDEIIKLYLFVTDDNSDLELTVTRPMLSAILESESDAHDYILPAGAATGQLKATVNTGGNLPDDYDWTVSDSDAATVTVNSAGTVLITKNQYLTASVPVTLSASVGGATIYSCKILLEVESGSQSVTLSNPTGGIMVGSGTVDWIIPKATTQGTLTATFTGMVASSTTWTSDNTGILTVSRSGNIITLKRVSIPDTSTTVNVKVNGGTAAFAVRVEGESGGGQLAVELPVGSSLTWDETTSSYVLPEEASSGNLAVVKTDISDTANISWTVSNSSFVSAIANAGNNSLKISRIGNNGAPHTVTITGYIDGSQSVQFLLRDMGGSNIEPGGNGSVELSTGDGLTFDDASNTYTLPSYNSYGTINVKMTDFGSHDTISYNTSRADVLGLSISAKGNALRITRKVAHPSEDVTAQLNVVINGVTAKTVNIKSDKSSTTGVVNPSFIALPYNGVTSNATGDWLCDETQPSASFSISSLNTTVENITWSTNSGGVTIDKNANIITVNKPDNMSNVITAEIIAKVAGTSIGSFMVNLYPYTGDIDREVTLEALENFAPGSSVDFVMTQDSVSGTFSVNYQNYTSGELEWSTDDPTVMTVTKGAGTLTLHRQSTLKSMTLVTLTVSSAYGAVESFDLLVPATDVAVGKYNIYVKVGSGMSLDEASGKMIITAPKPTFKIADGNSAYIEDSTITCSSNMVDLVDNKGTVTVTIPEGFDGEFTVNVSKESYNSTSQVFVVKRIASSEIYVDVISGANINVANGKFLMTGTTAKFSVTDYNYNFLGELIAACNDKYISLMVEEDVLTVTSPEGYNKEILLLLQADGFEDKYITLIPKSITEAGINLKQSNTDTSGWARTGTRSWNFNSDGDNTSFLAYLNPAAYSTAKIYQITDTGIKTLLQSTTESGGVSFSVNVPRNLLNEVEHELEIQMKDQTRTFSLVFESTGDNPDPDPDFEINLNVPSNKISKLDAETFEVQPNVDMAYVNIATSSETSVPPEIDWETNNTAISASKMGSMVVFEVSEVLQENAVGVLTISYEGLGSRSFTFTFKGENPPTSDYFSVLAYTGIQNYLNSKYVVASATNKVTFDLDQLADCPNTIYWTSSSEAVAPDLQTTFSANKGTLEVAIGLVSSDTDVTLSAFSTTSGGMAVYLGTINLLVPQNTGSTGDGSGALSDFVYKRTDKNTLHISIPNGYKVSNGSMLYIPMLVKIKSSDGATVKINASAGGTGIKSGTYLFAMSSKMGTTTKIDSVRNFKKDVVLADIRIMERASGVINEGTMTLKLDDGFVFVEGSEQNYLEGALSEHFNISGMTIKDGKATIDFTAKSTSASREGKTGTVILSNIEIKKEKGSDDSLGKIEMRISGVGMTSARLDVANCTGSDLAIMIDDEDEDMPVLITGQIYEDIIEEDIMTLDFTVAGKLDEAKKLGVEVPEGIIVRAVEVNDAYGIDDIVKGNIAYHEDNEEADDGYPILITDELIDLRDMIINDSEGASLSIKAYVAISPDYQEDTVTFNLTSGNGDDCIVAEVVKPVKPLTSSTLITEKLVKDKIYAFKDIELKETDKAIWTKPGDTVDSIFEPKFADDLYVSKNVVVGIEGFEITSVDSVTVSEGDIQISDYTLDRGVISFDLKRASRKASTVKLAGVKGKTSLTQLPTGGAALQVGGDSVAANYYEGKTKDVINTFTTPYMTLKGYIVSDSKDAIGYVDPTKDASGRTIAAALQIGSNEIVKSDGTIITMDTVPEIKDGRTMLPIRFVAEAIGVDSNNIIWNGENKTVVVMSNGTFCQLKIGDNYMYRSNPDGTIKTIEMDVAPYIKDGRTMLPIRFIAEALRLKVEWDANTQSVIIIQIASSDAEIGVVGPNGMAISDLGYSTGQLPSNIPPVAQQGNDLGAWSQFQQMLDGLMQSE